MERKLAGGGFFSSVKRPKVSGDSLLARPFYSVCCTQGCGDCGDCVISRQSVFGGGHSTVDTAAERTDVVTVSECGVDGGDEGDCTGRQTSSKTDMQTYEQLGRQLYRQTY